MTSWIKDLKENNIFLIENELLSRHTSWKIGGPVDALILPKDSVELIKTLKILKDNNIAWKILGNGSNILVSDKGYKGAFISLKKGFNQVMINHDLIVADANISLIQLVNLAAKNSLTGLEFATGIPGTIGGAITMNAGAYGSDISNILKNVEVLLDNSEIITWEKEDLVFGYRSSIIHKRNAIVLSATFNLIKGDYNEIIFNMKKYKQERLKNHPIGKYSAGSVFKNPSNEYAGKLIDELGLKGYSIGGAKVSTKHSNFIINTGNAKAKDVISLINFIKLEVYKKYNIELITEVEIIGEE